MKMNRWFVVLVLFCVATVAKAQMMDITAGTEAKLTKKLTVEADLGYRSLDEFKGNERATVEVGGEYSICRGVKAVASYSFIRKHYVDEETSKGNALENFWRNNNRITVGLQGAVKVGRFAITLREAYQFTHLQSVDVNYLNKDKVKTKEGKDQQLLRSRLKLTYNIKHSPFKPYISYEAYNDTKDDFSFAKSRYTVGTDIKIAKKYTYSVFYRFIDKSDGDESDGHMIGIGYTFRMK